MAKKPRLMRLVREGLDLVICFLKLIEQVIDLVNKVVNYARSVQELRVLVPE